MTGKVPKTTVNTTPQPSTDFERLDDFLCEQKDPLAGDLYAYLIKSLRVLALQPRVGRLVGAELRELIIDRGRSSYLARYE